MPRQRREKQEEVGQTSPSQLLEGDLTYEHQGGKRRALGFLAVNQMQKNGDPDCQSTDQK